MGNDKHKKALNQLIRKIENDYAKILRNQFYPENKKQFLGEVDVVAINPGIIDFYEVKSFYSINNCKKAKGQLKRARNFWQFEGTNYLYTPQHGIERLEEIIRKIKFKI